MADSGLETGSVTSPQGTISENSSTDLDEPNESEITIKTEQVPKIGNFCMTAYDYRDSTRENTAVRDEIAEYENRVLSDPFYELNGESDNDDDQASVHGPASSLQFSSQPNSFYLDNRNNGPTKEGPLKRDIIQNGKEDDIRVGQSQSPPPPKRQASNSSVNNYYFIDASSLNDDIDVNTSNIVGYPNEDNTRLNWSNPQMPTNCYSSSPKFSCIYLNDDPVKLPSRMSMSAQSRYDVGYGYKPSAGADSKKEAEESVSNDKESLAVEIKEADSGESAQHSPCPDNTKINAAKDEETMAARRASLIRRNTFELEATDEKLSSLRQEYERRQGSLVFQNSITQYSQHRIDDDAVPPYYEVSGFDGGDGLAPDKYRLDTSRKDASAVLPGTCGGLARSASDKLLKRLVTGDADAAFSSLPLSINDELGPTAAAVKSRIRRNDAAPIISGGSSSSDFRKPTDSPTVKRKTESTPILSGGSVLMALAETAQPKSKPKSQLPSSTAAWVVDMSDCRGSGTDGPTAAAQRSVMSASFGSSTTSASSRERERERQPSSLGYFVNLDEVQSGDDKRERVKPALEAKHRRRPSDSSRSYCEFFVDLSERPSGDKERTSEGPELQAATALCDSNDATGKKNMFSMFINLNDVAAGKPSQKPNQIAKSSSFSKLAEKRQELAQKLDSGMEAPAEQKKPKSGVFMFIESDSPIVRRRTMSSSRPAFKRHSWNMDKSQEQLLPSGNEQQQQQQPPPPPPPQPPSSSSDLVAKRLHKRAHSLSVDRNTTQDLRKMLAHKSSTSSHLLNEELNMVESLQTEQQKQHQQQQGDERKDDAFDYDIRDTPPNSHVEIIDEELLVSLKNRNYQELDAINDQTATGDKSRKPDDCASENSLWDKTPTDNTETQQTHKSETFDISSSTTGPSSSSDNVEFKLPDLLDVTQNKLTNNTLKHISLENSRNENNHEKITNSNGVNAAATNTSSFVKLSDLDKKPPSTSTNSGTPASTSRETPYRMSISVTETSWIENRLIMANRSAADFHRPYIKKLPLSIPKCSKLDIFDDFGGEGDVEAVISESDISSLQSSMGRSGQGSTEETETSTSFALGKPYNRLGEDLLRMFLDEINPDVTIDVSGRRIRAHKCILSSRCQYFAAILSGGWIESAGNVISLQGYSYNAVHFALCHIYSGESCIPDSISIVELATLADMLCLEGLKEVIGFTLKVKYCHLFHKPCKGCSVGVLECMPLAAAYGLDEVYRKSLRWVTRHFVRIWPTKEFATLPRELMDKCYHQHIVHMSTDNVLQTIMDCDKLLTTLPNVRWAEPVFRLVSNLLDASMKYLTDNFASVLGNDGFQVLDRELTWNMSRLEDHLLAAAERLPPEQACKSYSKLDKIFTVAQFDNSQRAKFKSTPLFMDLMEKIRTQVEKCLVRDAARAARTNAWLKMDLELRRRIQEMACLVILPNESTKRPSRHSNFMKEPKDRQDNKTTASRVTTTTRNLDLRRVKMAISEHNDRTLKQTPLLQTRKLMNKPKTDPLERKLQNDKSTNDVNSVSRPKSWPNKIEVKSRYLEPRNRPSIKDSTLQSNHEKAVATTGTVNQQRKKILISSSDSSRTSSPAMKRAAEKKALAKVPMKKDGKTLSSDSINSNSESMSRLGARKQATSKSCGITRAESPSLKAKHADTGLSVDSLSDSQKKALIKATKLDTSTDSLATETTSMATPKSTITNKSSPIFDKAITNVSLSQRQSYDKTKKSSPLAQQRSNSSNATRRPARSVESSTAASRSRAAATVSSYSGSLNLRKSLLDAAKAPDIPSKPATNPLAMTRSTFRQSTLSMRSSFTAKDKVQEKKSEDFNQKSNLSPASKRSPRTTVNSRLSKSNIVTTGKQKLTSKIEDKSSNKNKSQTTASVNRDGPKFLNQSSRSGTFLKDEPTILNKSDIETAAIDV
ncbi:uncharacterized protein LOC131674636 [Phymastichus coffea]|uniref:uncharacterized protein LOC131674636 n=1 Tax=Phymastichus coffea TaxID=108790 RepID=UPI00273A9A8C|nr:uncharacterized protein LOC131674636 [Phymastichus coffea]